MSKEKEDSVMRNYTMVVYPETYKIYMKLKKENNWTHDQTVRTLVAYYNEKEGVTHAKR